MKSMMSTFVVLLVLFDLCIPLQCQVAARQPEATSTISSLLVTAQIARDHIRFTALTVGSRMRLEILSQTGDTLYDSSFRPGNLIVWPIDEQQGSRLPDGVGWHNSTGSYNSFFGTSAGISNTVENYNSFLGYYSDGAAGITNATAIGYLAKVTQSNSLVLGGVNGVNFATAETNVGIGVTNPDRQLTVEGTQALGRFRRYNGTADPFTATLTPAFLFERARPTQAAPNPTDGLLSELHSNVPAPREQGRYGSLPGTPNSSDAQTGRSA
jgi:hypothetical protein